MKLTMEIDTENAKDITTLSRVTNALTWENFEVLPLDDPDAAVPYYPSESASAEVTTSNTTNVYEPSAEQPEEEAPPPPEDEPAAEQKPEKPKRTRRTKAEIEAEKAAAAAAETKAEEPKENARPVQTADEVPTEPAATPPELDEFGEFADASVPELTPEQKRNQIRSLLVSLRARKDGGVAEVVKLFAADGKNFKLTEVPDERLDELLAFADGWLNKVPG